MSHHTYQKRGAQLFATLVGLGLLLGFGFQNCTALPDSSTTDTTLNDTTSVSSSGLSLTQSGTTIGTASTLALSAYGGRAPYTYTLYSGPGSLSNSIFTATTAGSVIIRVQDALGSNAYFNLYVVDPATSTSSTGTVTTGTKTAIYQFLGPTHFYTTTYSEGVNAGFTYQLTPFYLASAAATGTQPLYRCYWSSVGGHFLSVDMYCAGSTNEGTAGYVYNSQVTGTSPLYSFYYAGNNDFIITTVYTDGSNAGYTFQGLLGYVFTAP